MNILAIDQGTSSTKALVFGPERDVLGEAEVAVVARTTAQGVVEHDPESLWRSVVDAARAALAAAGEPVAGIGLSNQGETVLAWDRKSGRPLSPALVWQDRRAVEITAALRHRRAELEGVTGLRLDPYFAAPKMAWLRRHMTTAGVVTTSDVWLLHRLCGAFASDAATASRTMLLDLDATAWSPAACDAFGVDPAELPAVVPCATVIGETQAWGTPIPVASACVDQQAALFAESCHGPGEAKCTFGTGAFLLATVGATPVRSRSGLVSCVAWRLSDRSTYCLDGQVYTAGAAVGWLQTVGLIAGPADLDAVGGSVGSTGGAIFVPGLAGLGAPFWRPAARGSFVGLSLATGRAHLVRAVCEGIAAEVALLATGAARDLGRPLDRLRVDGGLTRSATLMQIQADLLQPPVEVYPLPHATALGVAAFARLALDAAATPADAVGAWRPAAVFEPRISADEAATRLAAWLAAAERTEGLDAAHEASHATVCPSRPSSEKGLSA
jgi:glycerol kinase